jgi:septum formation protein
MEQIILASGSPRRAELLTAAGISFDIIPADVDETLQAGEMPEAYVRRVAEAKARAVMARAAGRPVLAADTVVVVDDLILGKPTDRDDAKRMLRLLSGRSHEVITGVTLAGRQVVAKVESTSVEFLPLTVDEIDWYVATGEADDKAGAYAIQGYASRFIVRISGSYSNVVGLPISLVYAMLRNAAR